MLTTAMPLLLHAQDKWDLRRCIEYALKNNVSVRQADIQARISALQYKQAKYNQLPSVNFGTGLGTQFGRSVNPTTYSYTTSQLLYQNFQLQGGMTLFNFGQLKNSTQAAMFSAQAAMKDVERAGNDIAINVATYYLQVLSAREQININQIQVAQTQSQLDDTRKRVEAGALPELNLAQLESQMSTDSANLITAQQTFEQNVLQLKAVLNIDAGAPFEVDTPPVEKIPLESIADLQPDVVYLLAMQNQPLQKVDSLKIKSAEKTLAANKALLYPRLSLSYSLQSNFSNTLKAQDLSKAVITGSTPTGDYVELNSNKYAVLTPTVSAPFESKSFSRWWDGYGSQLNNNFQQSVGISLSVPIFNNTNNYRINMEQSRLNLRNLQLQKEQDDITLKQNIYLAYTNAAAAMKKFNAGEKSVTYAQIAYDYARKRYEVGLLSTIDLLTTQNNLLKAKLQQLTNQYEYVFRMKLLEFYKGQGLKL